jgi:hypothetical protein
LAALAPASSPPPAIEGCLLAQSGEGKTFETAKSPIARSRQRQKGNCRKLDARQATQRRALMPLCRSRRGGSELLKLPSGRRTDIVRHARFDRSRPVTGSSGSIARAKSGVGCMAGRMRKFQLKCRDNAESAPHQD